MISTQFLIKFFNLYTVLDDLYNTRYFSEYKHKKFQDKIVYFCFHVYSSPVQ